MPLITALRKRQMNPFAFKVSLVYTGPGGQLCRDSVSKQNLKKKKAYNENLTWAFE